MSVPSESSKSATIKVRFPLSLRILIAVTLAVIVGSVCGPLGDLGELGLLVIRLLKAVAAPLIFLSIIEALVIAEIAGRDAIRLLTLSAVNAVVAVAIGLGMAHLVHGGERWRHHLDQLLTSVGTGAAASRPVEALGFSATLSRYIPDNLLDPILKNNIISLVLLAVAIGVALRQQQSTPAGRALLTLTQGALAVTRTLMEWLIVIIPFAVFAVVTSAVGKSGALLFSLLGIFVLTVVSGMALQTGVYYAALVRWAGGLSLRRFYSAASAPFMMALSTGSSVASVRVTLKSLDEDLKVSPRASRLSALVGTNLNHAGIILYEAVTAIFVAQALACISISANKSPLPWLRFWQASVLLVFLTPVS